MGKLKRWKQPAKTLTQGLDWVGRTGDLETVRRRLWAIITGVPAVIAAVSTWAISNPFWAVLVGSSICVAIGLWGGVLVKDVVERRKARDRATRRAERESKLATLSQSLPEIRDLLEVHRPPMDMDTRSQGRCYDKRFQLKVILEEQYKIPCPPYESPEHWRSFLVMIETDVMLNDLETARTTWDRLQQAATATGREDA